MNLADLPLTPALLARNPDLAGLVKAQKPASKYKNARAEAKGLTFQSGREAAGVAGLILLEEQHLIFGLRLQVRFPLQARIAYIADAVYLDKVLRVHVVDYKGFATPEFKLKKKLFEEKYGMTIEEV